MSVQLFIDKWLSKFEQSHFEWLLALTVLVTLAWICLAAFVYWRRAVTNLTPVDLPSANRDATPDFLNVDHKKRNQALARGDDYAAQLDGHVQPLQKAMSLRKVFGWTALVLACIAVSIVIAGVICPESIPGGWLNHYFENTTA